MGSPKIDLIEIILNPKKSEQKRDLNSILAELISIQMKYMEVQNYPETKIQCYATYVMQQSPVGSKEVPFINGFNSGSFLK